MFASQQLLGFLHCSIASPLVAPRHRLERRFLLSPSELPLAYLSCDGNRPFLQPASRSCLKSSLPALSLISSSIRTTAAVSSVSCNSMAKAGAVAFAPAVMVAVFSNRRLAVGVEDPRLHLYPAQHRLVLLTTTTSCAGRFICSCITSDACRQTRARAATTLMQVSIAWDSSTYLTGTAGESTPYLGRFRCPRAGSQAGSRPIV
jgi:hypothetical protein